MPRILIALPCVLVVGACGFSADYGGGHFTCTDDRCPSNLVCSSGVCVSADDHGDAPVPDAPPLDGPTAALTCADPEILPMLGGTVTGSTNTPRMNAVSPTCNALVMNARDAVYRVDATIGQKLNLTITTADTSYPVRAYAVTPCVVAPSIGSTCEGNVFASKGAPVAITATTTGHHWIVVDSDLANLSGAYTLTVTVTN